MLGIDTCGPSGSVALARLASDRLKLLGQTELAGRSYSATLVAYSVLLAVATGFTLILGPYRYPPTDHRDVSSELELRAIG